MNEFMNASDQDFIQTHVNCKSLLEEVIRDTQYQALC